MTRLSVLDQSPIRNGVTAADAVRETQPVPTVKEAQNYPYTERERTIVEDNRGRTIAGAPDQVRARLDELGRLYDIDEFVVVTICDRLEARLRSYELLAEVFGLQSRET